MISGQDFSVTCTEHTTTASPRYNDLSRLQPRRQLPHLTRYSPRVTIQSHCPESAVTVGMARDTTGARQRPRETGVTRRDGITRRHGYKSHGATVTPCQITSNR